MKPDDPTARMSHETIDAAIHAPPRGGLQASKFEAPRLAKPACGRRRTTLACSAMATEALGMINLPEEIDARLVPAHCEGDLIKVTFNRSSVSARWWNARPASLPCEASAAARWPATPDWPGG